MDEAVALVKVTTSAMIMKYYSYQVEQAHNFFMVPMNLLDETMKAAYADAWASKAIESKKLYGQVSVIASSKDKNYSYILKDMP
ncbi:MAG: hypothetical protein U0T36_03815 [Saprospiraceae bacterium]